MKKRNKQRIKGPAQKPKKQRSEQEILEKQAKEKAVADIMQEIKLKGPIHAKIVGNQVAVEEDYELFLPFYDRSCFGEIHGVKDKRIELSFSEALYLMERGKLSVYSNNKLLSLEQFVRIAKKSEQNFWTRYRVYRDLRTRGYTLKTALKFGADFRVYRRGVRPGEDHA